MSFGAPPPPAYTPPAPPPKPPAPIQQPIGTPGDYANKSGAGSPSFMSSAAPPPAQTGMRSLLGA